MKRWLMAILAILMLAGACSPAVETEEPYDPGPARARADKAHKELKKSEDQGH